MKNDFTNQNITPWWRWLFSNSRKCPALTFFFLSRANSTSPRFFPLFNEMKSLEIVLIKGTRFGKFDYFQLRALKVLERITQKWQRKYDWLLTSSVTRNFKYELNVALNLDDPHYSEVELNDIINWENNLLYSSKKSAIIVTSETTRSYLTSVGVKSPVFIIEQGYTNTPSITIPKNKNFSIVYSSPYIDIKGDKHGFHPLWGVEVFIKEIIPKIIEADKSIEIHLIGRLGNEAAKILNKYDQVISHGLKNFVENNLILNQAHVGLYPRIFDNHRRVQKIYEYIGANLPIVTFDVEDTKPVVQLGVGISVNNVDNFVKAVIKLKRNHNLYSHFYDNILKVKGDYSWQTLAMRFDQLIYNSFSAN